MNQVKPAAPIRILIAEDHTVVRDGLRGQAILVRDRSYEAPGCVRITVGTRHQTRRLLTALEEIWNQ